MRKKGKVVVWPKNDREADKASFHSSELSDLDSDVNSYHSLATCARSWIQDVKYREKGAWMMGIFIGIMMLSAAYCCIQISEVQVITGKHPKTVVQQSWLPYIYAASASCVPLAAMARFAIKKRNKKLLLITQIIALVVYAIWAATICTAYYSPVTVNPKSKAAACRGITGRSSNNALSNIAKSLRHLRNGDSAPKAGSTKKPAMGNKRHCKNLTEVDNELIEFVAHILVSACVAAISALLVVVGGFWYRFEIYYLEKRATAHRRRHRRRKHRIPWEKIKLVGPVMNCGAGGGGGGGGGKCPFSG
mmetsp:Transcript_30302/g.55363  ORF Transcript_30302/g.55363 Transcript_30302/m.55363 type:complete len:305 (+) Transcript_30302:337-1251(+)